MLTDFEICDGRTASDEPVIRCKNGKQLVLVHITEEAWEDCFPRETAGERHFDILGKNMLARSNLEPLSRLIQEMYDAKTYEIVGRMGGNYPLITIRYDDLKQIATELSAVVLMMRDQAHFATRG